ncbi:MAG: histidine phosphatase family protein [Eubacterium sp.]|nr:histidine phosphatase family protein [Eubacterium sp.]
MKIHLIRHGKTPGNELGRYIGTTDEHLSDSGVSALKMLKAPFAECIYISPMKRCSETAKLLYPTFETVVIEELRECDFGDFENKNYKELDGNTDYQAWIDSGGTLPFPHGESTKAFKDRTLCGFRKVLCDARKRGAEEIALVVHGGTIMAIMEAYDGGDYFSYQLKNGEFITLVVDET